MSRQILRSSNPQPDEVDDAALQRERATLLQELRTSQEEVSTLLAAMEAVQDWQREPAEWSFRYIAAHLATVERKCHLARIQRIAAGDHPVLDPYLNSGMDFSQWDLRESLARWQNERTVLLDFVARLPVAKLRLTGLHDLMGEITILDALDALLAQDRGHIRHLQQLIEDYYEEMAIFV